MAIQKANPRTHAITRRGLPRALFHLGRPSRAFFFAVTVVVGSAAFAPAGAFAQSTEYQETIERAIGEFNARRWAEARTLFRHAHALEPNARTLRAIGMCSFELGDYVSVVLAFEDALADARRPLSDTQRGEVERLLSDARTFVISAEGFQQDELRVEARGGSAETLTARLHLSDQDATEHVIGPDRSTTASLRRADAGADVAEETPRRDLAVAGWTSLGAGVAMGAVGLAVGLRSHAIYQDLVDACPCPNRTADIDRGEALGRASTALAFVGVGTGVAGTILLIVRRTGARSADGEHVADREPRMRVNGGPGELGAGLVVHF